MKTLALLLAITTASCTHEEARSLKYAGIVTMVGGGLVVVDPLLNGDPLGRNTTIAGNIIGVSGIAMLIAGIVLDPNNAAATK